MGFHICEYCKNETSSGDVTLIFKNGNVWRMPDMILHYIADHHYRPDEGFINDVLSEESLFEDSTKPMNIRKIGYLKGKFEKGKIEHSEFFPKLYSLIRKAEKSGLRLQTRSFKRT